ncbi:MULTISPECIES: hypothetical protein [unclassified Shinella]|jgi:H+/Cl- antiporter ClcA|uniref:hypothetical protein n=1 Tax=unclassified Shinella TaxID=2643062 RepID=UPI00234F77DB|nr:MULTISPECIES: hypothetical protein [unclassified Shinella]MCO5150743.1 hypothetical protein [Shinella sp.]MDC7263246.1 hypothetical protein [Shinella sp. HY16]MDC7270141.1 hypothetical protein [Shinella sp. YZ44]
MNEERPLTDRAVWLFVAIAMAGGMFAAGLAIRAFVSGRIALKHSVVTEIDKPFFFYLLTALLGLLAMWMLGEGIRIAIKHLPERR